MVPAGWAFPATLSTRMLFSPIQAITRSTGIGSWMSTSIEGFWNSRIAFRVHCSPGLFQLAAKRMVPSETCTFSRVRSG